MADALGLLAGIFHISLGDSLGINGASLIVSRDRPQEGLETYQKIPPDSFLKQYRLLTDIPHHIPILLHIHRSDIFAIKSDTSRSDVVEPL
jgi:hypothetical protein